MIENDVNLGKLTFQDLCAQFDAVRMPHLKLAVATRMVVKAATRIELAEASVLLGEANEAMIRGVVSRLREQSHV